MNMEQKSKHGLEGLWGGGAGGRQDPEHSLELVDYYL